MSNVSTTVQSAPLGFVDRVKTAGKIILTGQRPTDNPLASEPKDRSRGAMVEELTKWCSDTREFWRPVFDRMREEQRFAAGKQWPTNYELRTGQREPYQGDVVQQMVNRMTASLYAKNPVPEAVLEERLTFELWDGNQATIDAAQQIAAAFHAAKPQAEALIGQGVQVPAPPPQVTQALDILTDYQRGMQEKNLYKKIAHTGEMLVAQQWRSQSPDMLVSAKQATSQILVSRVAYIKAMYRRDMESVATTTANDMEFSDRVATLQAQLQTVEQDTTGEDDAKVFEAKKMRETIQQEIADMQAQQPPPVAGDEGVVHDWLASTSVLVDPNCTCLWEFTGASRIAHELMMTVEQAESKFKINLRDAGAKIYINLDGSYKRQTAQSFDQQDKAQMAKSAKVCVWEIQDKTTGLQYTVIDGVRDFIKEPGQQSPPVSRFWTIIPITFNRQVVEENDPQADVTIFPRSHIRLAMPMQQDINTAGEGLREHRVANRPGWTAVKSKFASTSGQNDALKLASPRNAHDLLMMENIQPGEKIADFIEPIPTQPIDPKMYDNAASSQAMMLATGEQPSDIGAQRPDEKATGQNIAAQARATSVGSNIDEFDFAFSTLAQMDWEMLVQEMDSETVKELVGRGATWADVAREDVARSIFFKIEAGSTGRPNEQADLNNFQVIAPQVGDMMKAAGLSLEPLIKEGVRRLGDKLDVDEFLQPAQVIAPPAQQAPVQKPPSLAMSLNVADLPPEEQEQAVQQFGIKPAPPASRLINKIGHGVAVKAAHDNKVAATPAFAAAPNQSFPNAHP